MANTSYPPLAGNDSQDVDPALQPFAGEALIISDTAVSTAAITQYQACALTAAGILPYSDDDHTKDQLVIAANAASGSGKVVSYYTSGKFNWEVVTWPAEYDTLEKVKAFVSGTNINVGHLLENGVNA